MSETVTAEGPVIMPGNGHGEPEHRSLTGTTLMAMISRAAMSGSVEALEKLIALYERNQDREREIAAKQAYARMHHEMPQIEKRGKVDSVTRRGSHVKYNFAPLEDIDLVARPIMAKHGFALAFRPIEQTDKYVIVEGELIHEHTGWSFKAQKQEPIDTEAYMGIQQKGGAAQTFAIRYLTVALLNIVVKGEDTDGRTERESGPVSSPPPEKSINNPFAKKHYATVKEGAKNRVEIIREAFAEADNKEDLEAFIDLIRDDVNQWDKPKQNDIGAALMKARARLSAAPERFDFPVHDAQGETDGEVFTDAASWLREFREHWDAATTADERDNLLHHNTDALEELKKVRGHLMEFVLKWGRETRVETADLSGDPPKPSVSHPLKFDAVQPPMNNGKPAWGAWHKAFVDEFMSLDDDVPQADVLSWVEAQKGIMGEADILYRQMAIALIAKGLTSAGIIKPDWLREMILPIKAAASHEEWGEARIAELYWVTNAEEFEAARQAAYPRMRAIGKENAVFQKVAAAFSQKQAAL